MTGLWENGYVSGKKYSGTGQGGRIGSVGDTTSNPIPHGLAPMYPVLSSDILRLRSVASHVMGMEVSCWEEKKGA